MKKNQAKTVWFWSTKCSFNC